MQVVQEDFKPRIKGIAKLILGLLTQLAGLFVNSIKDLELRQMAQGLIGSASKTVEVLADSNPNDKEQIKSIFNALLKDGPFKKGSQAQLLARINELTDSNVRLLLSIATSQAFPIGALLTDSDTDNSEQLKAHLQAFLRTEDGIVFLRSLLGIILPAAYADTAAVIILQLLLTRMEDEGDTANGAALIQLKTIYEARVLSVA
jgi:hypothetical protein